MTGLNPPSEWRGTSDDPNDEQFGDIVETVPELDDAVSPSSTRFSSANRSTTPSSVEKGPRTVRRRSARVSPE